MKKSNLARAHQLALTSIATLNNHPAVTAILQRMTEVDARISHLERLAERLFVDEPNEANEGERKRLHVELKNLEKRYFHTGLNNLVYLGELSPYSNVKHDFDD